MILRREGNIIWWQGSFKKPLHEGGLGMRFVVEKKKTLLGSGFDGLLNKAEFIWGYLGKIWCDG